MREQRSQKRVWWTGSVTEWSVVRTLVCLVFLSELGLSSGAMLFVKFLPDVVPLSISTNTVKRLDGAVACSENDADKICTCQVFDNIPFQTWWLPNDSGYFVYFDNTAKLQQMNYTVNVVCSSMNDGRPETNALIVQVQPNLPPVITNNPRDSVTVDATTTKQNTVVYTTTWVDPEDDAVTFTMTVIPDLGHFVIGTANGKVYSAVDMRFCAVDKYTLTITATDSFNPAKPHVVTVNLSPKNTPPRIANLPSSVAVPESAKKGDLVITLDLQDPDRYVDMNPICVVKNASDRFKFNFDMPNYQIKIAYDNVLDYETKPTLALTCTWCDGFLCDTKDLVVSVANINEEPLWSDTMYFCNIDEGNAGGPKCSLKASVKDPENSPLTVDVLTTNNEKYFKYDYTTDTMTFTVDYDLDSGTYETDLTAIMTATDNKGLIGTATVKIHVNDVNDNKCKTDSLKTFDLTEADPLKKLGEFSFSDDDATDPNNAVYFQVASATPTTSTDSIYVARNGEIFYTSLISPSQGTINMRLIIHCLDGGTPKQTATATLLVNFIVPTTTHLVTTYSTTTTERDVWSYEEFQAIFGTMMALVGLGLTLLLGSLVACFCAKKSWRDLIPRWRPKKPPAEKLVPRSIASPLPSHRSLPPIEHPPPINSKWENIAWNINSTKDLRPGTSYFHYH